MANEQVIITISAPTGQGLTVDTHAMSEEAKQRARLYEITPEVAGGTQTAEPAQPLAEVEKTPPAAAEPVSHVYKRATDPAPDVPAPKMKPWEDLSDHPTGMNFLPSPELHAKMNWVCDNVPKMNRQRILREGAMMLCDALIAKYYRKEEE